MARRRRSDVKDVEQAQEESVQPRAKGRSVHGMAGLINYLTAGSSFVSPWWSQQRDLDLSKFWRNSDKLSGALALLTAKVVTIPARVLPRDSSLISHQKDAEEFTIKFNEESEFGQGWAVTLSKWLEDWWCADNGAFLEIIGGGDKDGPIEGPASGMAHLDSHRCRRTGDPEFPVLYMRPDGGRFKLHWTRVAFASDQPSAREEMLGIGFCAISRTINAAQNLADIAHFKQEKLGSRPIRGILQGRGISTDAILDALAIAEEQMDNHGFTIFSQLPILGDIPSDAYLDMLELASLPDGFDEDNSVRLGMFTIALGFGVPIRWIWPSAVSGATKADAMYQHIAGLGGGIGRVLKVLTMLLGGDPRGTKHGRGKFLPEHLKLSFDFQDDEQDRMRSQVQSTRSKTRTSDLEAGVVTVRVAREQALENGDIMQAQFDDMELDDGRLPDGTSLLGLFHMAKKPYIEWLDLGVPNPLATTVNDALDMLAEINTAAINIQDVLANSARANTRKQAKQALAALNQIKGMYAPLAQQSVQREIMQRYQVRPVQEEEVEEGEKALGKKVAFEYAVSVGEVIGGELARGEGGRFINKDELMAQIRAGMMERLGGIGAVQNSASGARTGNRAEVAEAIGLDPSQLEDLAGMRTGATSLEQEQLLANMGLASANPDGSISMTSAGRALLAAANAGDVDKAEQLLAEAKAGDGDKPGKAPVGAKPVAPEKHDPEQVRVDNRAKVKEAVADRIDADDFDALVDFDKGMEIDQDRVRRLAQAGLVDIGADGTPTLSSAGKSLLSVAERGDVRDAKDVLYKARENVVNTLAQAEYARQQADDAIPVAEEMVEDNNVEIASVLEKAQRRVDEKLESVGELSIKANKIDEEAAKLDSSAAETEARISGFTDDLLEATDPDIIAYLSSKIEILQGQADRIRGQASDKRSEAGAVRDDANDAYTHAEEIARDAERRAMELQKEAQDNMEQAEARRVQLLVYADELEARVGGGASAKPEYELEEGSWVKRAISTVKRFLE